MYHTGTNTNAEYAAENTNCLNALYSTSHRALSAVLLLSAAPELAGTAPSAQG